MDFLMNTGFTREETDQILQTKDTLKVFISSSISLYEWAAGVFNNGLSKPNDGISTNFYVSGGAIASLLLNEAPKDFDIYCRNESLVGSLQDALINNYKDQVKDVDENYREVKCWKVPGKMVTEKSITMNNNMSFIVMQHGEPDKIKATFDFLHCTPHYDIAEDKLYISRAQFDSIKSRTLIVNNPDNIVIHRLEKFLTRGWNTSPEVKALSLKNTFDNKTLTPDLVIS